MRLPNFASGSRRAGYRVLILATALFALALRLPRLDQRPMHTDEAVHADKFGELLEEGNYRYDIHDYHGPTLNYLTLLPAWLGSAKTLTEIDEFTLRIVPVSFGVFLVLLLLLVVEGLGGKSVALAAIFAAISPAMVFYSRYYIQEMLLVCFTFGALVCGYRYARNKTVTYALLTGLFLGLMHATKETCIIAFGCMALAAVVVLLMRPRGGGSVLDVIKVLRPAYLIICLAMALTVSALFYSSFLANPRGVLDSFLSYTTYFGRAGDSSLHIHPWYYYLKMLVFSKYGAGPVWSEALVVVLSVVGFAAIVRGKSTAVLDLNLARFVAFYTLAMTIVYSAIPYKTPWCLLSFLHGMILLAGVGVATIIQRISKLPLRLAFVTVLAGASIHLGWQAYRGSYRYCADSRNPYVYAHTSMDVFPMVRRIEEIAAVYPEPSRMEIHVICPGGDHWPLPWYLRHLAGPVGYYNEVTDDVVRASMIVAYASLDKEILTKLYELPPPGHKSLYVPLFDTYMELRPGIELRGYLRKELWDRYQRSLSKTPAEAVES